MSRLSLCLALAALAAGAAPAGAQPAESPHLARLRERARQLSAAAQAFQEEVVAELGGRRERDLYRRADAVLAEAQRFREALQAGGPRDRAGAAFEAVHRRVAELAEAARTQAAGRHGVQRAAARVQDAERELADALGGRKGRPPLAAGDLAADLAAEARRLYEAAGYALPADLPGRDGLTEDLRHFADAAERFANTPAGAARRGRREFAEVSAAWARVSRRLGAAHLADAPYLALRVARTHRAYDRLAAALGPAAEFRPEVGPGGRRAGRWYVILNRSSGKCLDVRDGSRDDGAWVQQWGYNGGLQQQWRLEPVGDGWYRVVNRNSGKCLDVRDASAADGAHIQQWTYNGGLQQQWRPEPVGDGWYKLVNRQSGKCLDVTDVSPDDGAWVQQWGYNGGLQQQWRLTPAEEG